LPHFDGRNGSGKQKMSKYFAREKRKTIKTKRLLRDLIARGKHVFSMSSRLSSVIVVGMLIIHKTAVSKPELSELFASDTFF